MENQKYLNEEKYQQNNAKVKKVGKILLILGIITSILGVICTITSFIGVGNIVATDFNSFDNNVVIDSVQETINGTQNTAKGIFGNIGLFALGGFMDTIGFTLTAIGGVLLFISHRREITAYTSQQIIPVGKEIVEEVTPTIGSAAGTIAQNISKGIKEGLKDNNNN